MYYIGIDWGKSKCGIAIADKENRIASTHKQVKEIDLYQEIFDFIQKESVKKIIIGYHSDLMLNSKFKKFLEKNRKKNGEKFLIKSNKSYLSSSMTITWPDSSKSNLNIYSMMKSTLDFIKRQKNPIEETLKKVMNEY
jgi:RNase H-fold protein (predicted Holliday junction resolvase)